MARKDNDRTKALDQSVWDIERYTEEYHIFILLFLYFKLDFHNSQIEGEVEHLQEGKWLSIKIVSEHEFQNLMCRKILQDSQ